LPPAIARALQTERYDVCVAIGAVVRGETPHFDVVAGEAARGLALLQGEFGVPIGLGLLTTDTMAQAEARAGGDHGNKGWDAAVAALEMSDLFGRLDQMDGEDDGAA
jgi:6,7-dimethyl-8-ribityllumazine synthase